MPAFRLRGLSLLLAFLISVYTLTSSGGFHIVDEVSLFAVTESLAQRGDVDTNAIVWTQWVNSPGEVLGAFGPGGEVYSKKGPAPAFLSVPWYTLIHFGAKLGLPWGLLQGTLLWNGIVTAGTAALLWLVALRLGYDDRTGMLLGLLFGLGTIAWPYANHLFGEPLSAFSLLLCFYGVQGAGVRGERERGREGEREGTEGDNGTKGKGGTGETRPSPPATRHSHALWLAGIGAGIAIATVTAHALLVAVLGLYLLFHVSRNSAPAIRQPALDCIGGIGRRLAGRHVPETGVVLQE